MDVKITVSEADVRDGQLIPFGPVDPETKRQLHILETFTRAVTYEDMPFRLVLGCVFDGEKIQVQKLTIEGMGAFVTSRDLTQLALPSVIRQVGMSVIPESEFWTQDWQDANSVKEGLKANSYFLAQMYWMEHATWGSPRVTIQNYLQCQRTTANYYIRLAANIVGLPGLHGKKK